MLLVLQEARSRSFPMSVYICHVFEVRFGKNIFCASRRLLLKMFLWKSDILLYRMFLEGRFNTNTF